MSMKHKKIIHLVPDDNMWGAHIKWRDWKDRTVYGHFPQRFDNGTVFAQRMNSKKVGLFRLIEVEWCNDPRDMFFAKAEDIGYAEDYPEYLHEMEGIC